MVESFVALNFRFSKPKSFFVAIPKSYQGRRPQRHNLTLQHPQGNCHHCRFHGSVVLCSVQITRKSGLHQGELGAFTFLQSINKSRYTLCCRKVTAVIAGGSWQTYNIQGIKTSELLLTIRIHLSEAWKMSLPPEWIAIWNRKDWFLVWLGTWLNTSYVDAGSTRQAFHSNVGYEMRIDEIYELIGRSNSKLQRSVGQYSSSTNRQAAEESKEKNSLRQNCTLKTPLLDG